MKPLRALFCALAVACGACSASDDPSARAAPPQPGFEVETVRYLLAFRPGSEQRDAQGAVILTTNRGARVALSRALLSTHSASLVPCAPLPPPAPARSAWLTRELLGVPRARAGHTGRADASAAQAGVMEDMRAGPAPLELATRSFPPARYCRVHYLIGGARAGQRGLAESELVGASLVLEGTLLAPALTGGGLSVRSKLAHGNLSELSTLLAAAGQPTGRLELTFTRELGSLLDDLELSSATPKEIERGVLRNLLAHARVTARWF